MPQNLFPSPPWPSLPVQGETARYPLHRIFCVGRNYADHAAEMGSQVDREQPIFFTKSAFAYLPSGMESNYPPGTDNYHYEVEFCVVLGKPLFKASPEEAAQAVYGYAVGLDMTRRDLQNRAKENRMPWDTAKDVEESRSSVRSPARAISVRFRISASDCGWTVNCVRMAPCRQWSGQSRSCCRGFRHCIIWRRAIC